MKFRPPFKMLNFLEKYPETLFGIIKGKFVSTNKINSYDLKSDELKFTEKQIWIIKRSYELGYFEYPRKITIKELSIELGLVPSTLSVHLQKVMAKIMKQVEVHVA